jgi:hypothetical protein
MRYRLNGNNLWLTPIPTAGQLMQLWYVPSMTQLAADNDTLSTPSGWDEYVIIDAAIKCLQKEESDTSVLMNQKMAIIQRIEAAAENRDAGNPQTVCDTQWSDYGWPTGNGGPFGGAF